MSWLNRPIYSLLLRLAAPLLLLRLLLRGRKEPAYTQLIGQRLGFYGPLQPVRGALWLHAVSLGEMRTAALLIRQWRLQNPDTPLLLTCSTATGRAEGENLLDAQTQLIWLPWDMPGAVKRFLRAFKPSMGLLMETEVWPNLVAACRRQGIPLVQANARLNDASLRKALRLGWLARPAYRGLTAVWAQTEADAQRLRALGAPVQGVFGNLKFDVEPDGAQLAQGRAWRTAHAQPVVLLASSREGEEALWLDGLKQKVAPALTGQAPAAINSEVQWLIVPRHPQRFDAVEQILRAAGLSVARRSCWQGGPPRADVWLGDSLGEMALYYGLADVALLGGSFAPLGGQNLIEAAACACPVVLGPHTFNFADAAQKACAAGAAQRVDGMAQGVDAACALACDAVALAAARAAAQGFAQAHRGAAQATADAVRRLLHP